MRCLLLVSVFHIALTCCAAEFAAPRQVDERRAAAVGLRKIVSRHLRLYTDLPASDAVDSLPVVFDAAVPLWAEYFHADIDELRDWRMQGYLIQDRAKFAALGLLPTERPEFTNGYSNGYELWWMEQPSDYFRRHLMLHEGTHGFMYTTLGDTGPGWYMEGMAELLGTHRWHDGDLRLRVMPKHRNEVPMWGRIRLVRAAQRAGNPRPLPSLLALDKRRAFSTAEYAWSWALCEFLDSHPRLQKKFRELPRHLGEPQFNERFRQDFHTEWNDLLAEWQAFIASLDYGYDAERMAMQHRPSVPVTQSASETVEAARGWQSTGWLLRAAQQYQITATGRYQIADDGGPWPSEPGGVTLEYHEGQPLGMLLGAWRTQQGNRFSASFPIGLGATLQPVEDAVLYLRVNDSPAKLSDNQGELNASIRSVGD